MIFKMRQKRLFIMLPAILLLLFSLSTLSFGESVFLKDGNILEGKISKENDKKITITLLTDETREIERKDIIRTIYHSNYKDKKYLTKMDGTVLEVYIVDEDKTVYFYRLKLDSPDEVRIAKDEVDGISKRKVVAPVAREETREEKLVTRAPRIRFGLTIAGPLDKSEDNLTSDLGSFEGLFADLFLYRMRNEKGNGFDLFVRGICNLYKIKDPENLGYENPSSWISTKTDAQIDDLGIGCGIRYSHGWYLGGILWQAYLLGYYQYSTGEVWIKYERENTGTGTYQDDIDEHYKSHGAAGGAGLEIGLFTNLGIFGEYTYGYHKIPFPAGDENIEGGAIRFGVSIRTSYL